MFSWSSILEDYLHADVFLLRNEKLLRNGRRGWFQKIRPSSGAGEAWLPLCDGASFWWSGAESESLIVGNEIGGISGSSKDPTLGSARTVSTPRGGSGANGPGGAGGSDGARGTTVPAAEDFGNALPREGSWIEAVSINFCFW